MKPQTIVYTYNYPRDQVFDAVKYAINTYLFIGSFFYDKKAGYIGCGRVQNPYLPIDNYLSFTLRDDNINQTKLIIKVSCCRKWIGNNYYKRNIKYMVRLNNIIIKYLDGAYNPYRHPPSIISNNILYHYPAEQVFRAAAAAVKNQPNLQIDIIDEKAGFIKVCSLINEFLNIFTFKTSEIDSDQTNLLITYIETTDNNIIRNRILHLNNIIKAISDNLN